jgi:hypothetical protein
MKKTLVKYFTQYGHLEFPKIGNLKLHKLDPIFNGDQWEAPKYLIHFDPTETQVDKHFYIYISESLEISIDQAIVKFDEFINSIISITSATYTIEGLGDFIVNHGKIEWISDFDSNTYYENLDFTPVQSVSEELDGVNTDKEYWIKWALIILILSMAAIIFKYYS